MAKIIKLKDKKKKGKEQVLDVHEPKMGGKGSATPDPEGEKGNK